MTINFTDGIVTDIDIPQEFDSRNTVGMHSLLEHPSADLVKITATKTRFPPTVMLKLFHVK